MVPRMHREKKRCLAASLLLLCLALLISSLRDYGASPGGTNAGIVWLPLTQTAPPSKVAELRQNILTFLEPFRRKVFGDPDVILTTASFISISPIAQSQDVFPPATSTNSDGTLACVLSADKLSSYHQRIRKIEGVNEFAA